MKSLLQKLLLFFTIAVLCLAEETSNPAISTYQERNTPSTQHKKDKVIKRIKKKFSNSQGKPVSIGIFKPIDQTSAKVGNYVIHSIKNLLIKYEISQIKEKNYTLESISLEEMRMAMSKFKVDILVLTVLKDTNFDLYIYDRRTPYHIYAHSEALAVTAKLNMTKELAEYYAKLLLRRTLYRYIYDQYFELPRHEASPFLRADIPRWIASVESLQETNREIKSIFYGGAQTGAAFVYGRRQKIWNSSILGAFIGVNPFDRFYIELAVDTSAYNTFVGSLKYIFGSKVTPFKVQLGVGWGYVTAEKVWVVDDTFGLRKTSYHVVPSVTLLFPLGKVYLKLEQRTYIGLEESKFMFTLMPGIFMHF